MTKMNEKEQKKAHSTKARKKTSRDLNDFLPDEIRDDPRYNPDTGQPEKLSPDEIEKAIQKLKEKQKHEKTKAGRFQSIINILSETFNIRYNEVNNKIEWKRADKRSQDYEEVNFDDAYIFITTESRISTSQADLKSIIKSSQVSKKYNPFKEYFEGLKYDGGNHIDRLTDYVKTTGQERFKTQFRKHLIRSVACALHDDKWNKHALIFVSNRKQNIGKTTFLRWLSPPAFKKYYFEGSINPEDKDSLPRLSQNFIINLDELANVGRRELNHLKTYFSKESINVRLPYEARPVTMPRRANFFGSTNDDDFLTDTDNVRYIIFEVSEINHAYHDFQTGKTEIDINQVWAEAYEAFKTGEPYNLTAEEIQANEETANNYKNVTVEQDLILTYLEPASSGTTGADKMNMTEILEYLNTVTERKINFSVKYFSSDLKRAGFDPVKIRGKRIYWVNKKDPITKTNQPQQPKIDPNDLPF